MATVIDQLIVTLGLDGSQFKKGTDEAARRTKATQELFKKSGEAMTKSIVDVARNITVAFIGFETASGLVNFLAKINQAQASLSRMSLNLGTSARALDVWDKKIELAGGSVAGAQAAIQQLMQDATRLQTVGEASPLLQFFQKMGISAANSAFSADRAADAYEQLFAKLRSMPRSVAYEYGIAHGISPDILNYGLRPFAEREDIARKALRLTAQTTDAGAKAADNLRMQWVAIKDQMEQIGIVFLTKITPTIERLLPIVERLGNEFANWLASLNTSDPGKTLFDTLDTRVDGLLSKVISLRYAVRKVLSGDFSDAGPAAVHALADSFNNPKEALQQFRQHDAFFGAQPESLWSRVKQFFSWTAGAPYMDAFRAAATKYDLPPGLLESIADRESGFNPNAKGKAGELGMMQLRPEYHPDAGKDPVADIFEAAKTLSDLRQQLGSLEAAKAAYNAGSGRISRALAGQATVPPSTRDYVTGIGNEMNAIRTGARSPASLASGSSVVFEGDIIINTRATDGKGVASDFITEMKKRDLILQSDTGIVP
jgi:hypothetical protein